MPRSTRAVGALLAVVAALANPPLAEAATTLKLATLAPSGSAWHDLLRELAQAWEQASGGQLKVKVYPGGAQGSEGEMVRKLGIGQLQAAALSNVGLHDVVPEPQAFSTPFLFRDEAELRCAFARVRPSLEAAFERRGLVPVQWSVIGGASLFCSRPVGTPEELSQRKLFAWEGDPGSAEAWRAAGFHPVVLSSTDLVPALQTGMVDCLTNVPLYVLTAHLYERARHQVDLPWGYLMAAVVVRRDAWEELPPALRPRLLEIARSLGERIDREAGRLNADALEAMRRQGLQTVPADPSAWRVALERTWPALRGPVVPVPFFDEVRAARDACRSSGALPAR
jgi:TRAP-type C4-dicarboxylate transport system substrate-binding protein